MASFKYHKVTTAELEHTLEAIINAILGSTDLQNKLNNDVDANLFFREDPVYFLREMSVEFEQNSLMEICKLGLVSQTEYVMYLLKGPRTNNCR